MKVKLTVSEERYAALQKVLADHGIEVDENADLVLSENRRDTLMVRRNGERFILAAEEIVYIEAQGHTVTVHTKDSAYQTQERLYRMQTLLEPEKFLRVSNSVIIAKNKVKRITPTLSMKFILTMEDGAKVDVTRSYYYMFKEAFGI